MSTYDKQKTHKDMIPRNVAFVCTDVDGKHNSDTIVINIGLIILWSGLVIVLRTLYTPLTHRTVGMAEQLNELCRLCSPARARTQTT